jgi:hypothetical protein
MKQTLLALALLFSFAPAAAHADETTKRAKVEQLLTLLKVDQLSDNVMNNLKRQVDAVGARAAGPSSTPEQKKDFQDFQNSVTALVQKTIAWPVIKPDYIKLYSDSYTEPEIDAILTFYHSPAGQALLTKSPEVTTKSIAITQQHMQPIEPQLRQMAQDFSAKMQAAGPPAGEGAPSTARPAPSLGPSPTPATPAPAPKK